MPSVIDSDSPHKFPRSNGHEKDPREERILEERSEFERQASIKGINLHTIGNEPEHLRLSIANSTRPKILEYKNSPSPKMIPRAPSTPSDHIMSDHFRQKIKTNNQIIKIKKLDLTRLNNQSPAISTERKIQ